MTVSKLTNSVKPLDEVDKINEIIDELNNANVAIDNSTITKNASDQLQTVAIKDNRSGNAIKTWTGTKAQYEAITTKDATTLYNITDDTDVTLPLLELLFPVGAVYFGTMSVCPLQVLGVGTWQALPQDKVIQIAGIRGSVGTTINESLPNITGEVSVRRQNNAGTLTYSSGAFYDGGLGGNSDSIFYSTDTVSQYNKVGFNASNSSDTYQDNAPVQQDAYLLNGWRRIS